MLYSPSMTPVVVALITYVLFIFLGESLNPFKSPRGQLRFRWRFARTVSLIFFVCAFAALFFKAQMQLSVVEAVGLLTAMCVVLSIYPAIRYYRAVKVETLRREEATNIALEPVVNTSSKTDQPAADQDAINNPIENLPALSMAQLPVEKVALSVDVQEPVEVIEQAGSVVISDEYRLEQSLVEPGDDFDPLDHTIAEADFHIEALSKSAEFDVAKPIMAGEANDLLLDDIEDGRDQLEESLDDSLSSFSDIDVEATESNALLLEKISLQEAKIRKITKTNESLAQAREALVDEVADLKYEVKKRGTIARKSIAQRNEALEIKDRALALAAMEQKKRKLTEVRARKALMKMRASLQMLSDQSAQQKQV